MKISSQRISRVRRGYTLMELSLAMMTGMMIAAMLLAIFQQQVSFLQIFKRQSFLTTEAPIINNYLSRIMGTAEGFRLYSSIESLRANEEAVTEEAPVLQLLFKEQGVFRAAILSFDVGDGLNFRRVSTTSVITEPEWSLSKEVKDVKFSIVEGILRIELTGPNDEVITYSGSQQL